MKIEELVTFNEDGSITCHWKDGKPNKKIKCMHPLKLAITDGLYECGWCHDVIPENQVLSKLKSIVI